jgi:hypothetical protein
MYQKVLPGRWVPTPGRRSSWSSPDLYHLQRLPGDLVNILSAGDPLADYAFQIRLQTHFGDNVPLGMYQDVACTIPAVNEFDPVAAWRDEITGSVLLLSNANTDQQPMLLFIDGKPVITTDGIDDVLIQPISGFQPAYIAARTQFISGSGRVTTQPGGGNGGFTSFSGWTARYGGSDIVLGPPTAGFDSLFIQGGVGTSRTALNGANTPQADNSLPVATWTMGGDGTSQVLAMNMVALYFGALPIDASQQTVLENYTATLAP